MINITGSITCSSFNKSSTSIKVRQMLVMAYLNCSLMLYLSYASLSILNLKRSHEFLATYEGRKERRRRKHKKRKKKRKKNHLQKHTPPLPKFGKRKNLFQLKNRASLFPIFKNWPEVLPLNPTLHPCKEATMEKKREGT